MTQIPVNQKCKNENNKVYYNKSTKEEGYCTHSVYIVHRSKCDEYKRISEKEYKESESESRS